MKRSAWLWVLFVPLLQVLAQQQQREAHIGYIFPAGGQQGTTFEAVIGGANLAEATGVMVSGTGVSATIAKQEKQVTPKEQQELKEELSKLQEKRKQGEKLSMEDMEMAEHAKERLTAFGRRLANPSLGEFVTLKIVVAKDAVPGPREIRLHSRAGLSNPRTFMIGKLPEFSKKDWKNVPKSRLSMDAKIDATPAPITVTLPITLNGQIPPGGIDTYRFNARAGQRLVVSVSARELIPYLADAVPGWVQATVGLYDAKSNEVAFADDYKFRPDPVIFFTIPKEGAYFLKIHDSLFRGREDFVYRMTIGEEPFITSIFPSGGQIGTKTPVRLTGWNLPFTQAELDFRNQLPGIYPFQMNKISNPVPLLLDTLPERFEVEPNGAKTNAMAVALPIIINGHIDQSGDWDVFSFNGKMGQQVVLEVFARRLDSPVDSVLRLFDPLGKQVASNDDQEDKSSGLNTHHADSYLSVTLQTAGCYTVYLGDTQRGGGPAYAYRLRLSAPRPDFELRVTPPSINVRNGSSIPLTAFALRKDGFTNEIVLSLKGAPKDYRLTGAVIPANQDQIKFTLTPPMGTDQEPISLFIEGRAVLQGRTIVKSAMPADDMMQAFAYRHLVPAQELKVAVLGKFRARKEMEVASQSPVRISAGGTVQIDLRLPTGGMVKEIAYELLDPPPGISIKEMKEDGLVLQTDATKVKPGQKGNLIIMASGEPTMGNKQTAVANKFRMTLGAFPAVTYEITK